MAGAGYKLYNTGDVLTATDVNTYLMQQTVMVFDDAAARTTALSGVVAEGMLSYLKDTNAVEVYDGANWVASDDPNAIQNTIVAAKGDIIGASANDVPAVTSVGADGTVLTADSSTSTGLTWQAPAIILETANAKIGTSQTTTSTSFTDLATVGPSVTLTTGTKVLILIGARISNSSANTASIMSVAVTGASTVAAGDSRGIYWNNVNANDSLAAAGVTNLTVTAGSNTFTAKYRVLSGTGTFVERSLYVIDLGS